ncbi:Transposase and inactivated derivatives [Sphingobacterium mizutaii]|uniref:Transposase and inactivated derivatives n=3 Tax=Sphingobacterium mizutaii TaxID=1010 RepID=A0AAJ4XF98_9SPHI|nr:Helix-turn-helix domain of resolvase [Sphingobacterium mizutaii]SNV62626.1 Transposase and inactivated derivatives [Sphingobacterium mizutaii]
MSQIKQLIRLHRENYPIKTIARHLSISKNTVKSYLKKVTDLNLSLERILELEDPVLERMLRSGNPAYRDERFEYLFEDTLQVQILAEEWLQDYNYKRPHESLGGKTPMEYDALPAACYQ